MSVRVRFAPSPTGALHAGSVRSTLFNWLFARHHDGTFILRIEDTDRSRSTDASIADIQKSLRWLGLDWNEYYRQTDRLPVYQEMASQLLESGKAYEHEGAIWLRMPKTGRTVVHDEILGDVTFDNTELDDWVIQRSNGFPTYNFAAPVDDIELKISHVIRGNEHLNNTPKQLLVYEALGEAPPAFAHVPMVLGKDRTKLSKRHGARSVLEYREAGYLPEAMVNFLVLLGWSPKETQEIFTVEELIERFTLDGVGKASPIFDEEKLLWINHEHMKRASGARLAPLLREALTRMGIAEDALEEARLIEAAELMKTRSRALTELAKSMKFLFTDAVEYDPQGVKKFFKPEKAPLLRGLIDVLDRVEPFRALALEEAVRSYLKEQGASLGDVAQTSRVAMTGKTIGPGLFETMEALGRTRTVNRLQQVVERLEPSR
ncbi:MAG: glutamate--tRNA ligase [Candidatus Bipolaricaulia bacterium]